jgi:hypothetical protein
VCAEFAALCRRLDLFTRIDELMPWRYAQS